MLCWKKARKRSEEYVVFNLFIKLSCRLRLKSIEKVVKKLICKVTITDTCMNVRTNMQIKVSLWHSYERVYEYANLGVNNIR